ncbi:26 kDa periplasmic immunogenic protein [Gracilariopsis chorda]|uniref:26 kDa periplasmic immunogenic protein n=1 Tax=Gracilariopsis chorda TaxID=448386 RepID=A0A2V3IQE7_9FLOR|nr:26 kDa periplasmic immunogenic protein [Gracilariopsis chorda]|eukprot:PXF44325.1 26 kDa periplasmic immunogenic protein [Gracilariopsis chorda]
MATFAQSQNIPRTITVSGRGTASAPPDTATINTGVETTAATAQEALAANNRQFQSVLAVLSEQGIEDRDVQTSFFNVNPQFRFGPNGEQLGITGYQVSNQVRVIVRDIEKLGQILDALVAAGSNQVSGVSFSIEDNQEITDTARAAAVADATRTAGVFAAAAGVKVGRLIAVSDQSIQAPEPPSFSLQAEAADVVPIASGELEITSNVNLQFELVNA